jgi:hypothetical protein
MFVVLNENLEYYAAWDDRPSLEKLGLRLASEEKHAEAMVKLNRAVELGSDTGRIWRALGNCCYHVWQEVPDEFYHLEQGIECHKVNNLETMHIKTHWGVFST